MRAHLIDDEGIGWRQAALRDRACLTIMVSRVGIFALGIGNTAQCIMREAGFERVRSEAGGERQRLLGIPRCRVHLARVDFNHRQ